MKDSDCTAHDSNMYIKILLKITFQSSDHPAYMIAADILQLIFHGKKNKPKFTLQFQDGNVNDCGAGVLSLCCLMISGLNKNIQCHV